MPQQEEVQLEGEPITLVLQAGGQARRFPSPNAVVDFLRLEQEKWRQLTAGVRIRDSSLLHAVGARYKQVLDSLESVAQRAAGATGGAPTAAARERLISSFAANYGGGELVCSTSPEGAFALAGGSSFRIAGRVAGLLPTLTNRLGASRPSKGDELRGLCEGILFSAGFATDGVQSIRGEHRKAVVEWVTKLEELRQREERRLSDLHSKQSAEFGRLHAEVDQLPAELSRLYTELGRLHAERTERFDTLEAQQRTSADIILDRLRAAEAKIGEDQDQRRAEFKVRLAAVDQTIKDWEAQMKLRVKTSLPKSFWVTKEKEHRRNAWFAAGAAAAFAIAFASSFIALTFNVLTVDDLNHDDYARIVVLFTLGTLGVWVLRILVRVLLSELHLRGDAREREVLLDTYVALAEDKDTQLSPADRQIVLTYLFRPAASGIVSDDGAPPSLQEILSRMTTRP